MDQLGREGLPVVPTRSGSASLPVNALAVSGGTLYAATDHGVFQRTLSSNATTAWSSLSRGLPESTVTSLTAVDNRLLAGTVRGAYALALT
jgi:outer membrane protein assembly factor BamB